MCLRRMLLLETGSKDPVYMCQQAVEEERKEKRDRKSG